MPKLTRLAGVAALSASCVVPPGARPGADVDLQVVSAQVYRGVVQSDTPVLIPTVAVTLPAKEDGRVILETTGNMDLASDNGNAWRPDGQAGSFSWLQWGALYEQLLGDFALVFGLISYNLARADELQQADGSPLGFDGSTTELMVEAVTELYGVNTGLRASYDIDEIEGLYLQLGGDKSWQLDEQLSVGAGLSLGWMDQNQAYYQLGQYPRSGGLADLRLESGLTYEYDRHTTLRFDLGYSSMMDSGFRYSLGKLGIDADKLWAGVGVHWSY